jgi:uncharacterized membrane protein YqiK
VGEGNAATHHNSFQDPEQFLAAGGWRGRQHQVLVEGTDYINRLFATVACIAKTVVEVGHVGVVISYTGAISGQSGAQGTPGSAFEALLAMMLSDRVGDRGDHLEPAARGDKVQAMPARDPRLDQARDAIRDGLVATLGGGDGARPR